MITTVNFPLFSHPLALFTPSNLFTILMLNQICKYILCFCLHCFTPFIHGLCSLWFYLRRIWSFWLLLKIYEFQYWTTICIADTTAIVFCLPRIWLCFVLLLKRISFSLCKQVCLGRMYSQNLLSRKFFSNTYVTRW